MTVIQWSKHLTQQQPLGFAHQVCFVFFFFFFFFGIFAINGIRWWASSSFFLHRQTLFFSFSFLSSTFFPIFLFLLLPKQQLRAIRTWRWQMTTRLPSIFPHTIQQLLLPLYPKTCTRRGYVLLFVVVVVLTRKKRNVSLCNSFSLLPVSPVVCVTPLMAINSQWEEEVMIFSKEKRVVVFWNL